MVGPRMAVLMLVPALLGLVVGSIAQRFLPKGSLPSAIHGVPWVLLAAALEVARHLVLAQSNVELPWINRGFAVADILIAITVLWLNRPRRSGLLGFSAVTFLGVGVICNAMAVVLVGAMPYSVDAAHQAGLPPAEISGYLPGYVHSDLVSPVAAALGDFMPFAPLMKVMSVGDVLLILGVILVVALFTARTFTKPSLAAHAVGRHVPRAATMK